MSLPKMSPALTAISQTLKNRKLSVDYFHETTLHPKFVQIDQNGTSGQHILLILIFPGRTY